MATTRPEPAPAPSTTPGSKPRSEASTGETAEPNTLKDKFGIERPYDGEKYPDESPAHQGRTTKPSGQGGANPKSRPDHQDMFPPNPEPSESARAKGEELDALEQGKHDAAQAAEDKQVEVASDARSKS